GGAAHLHVAEVADAHAHAVAVLVAEEAVDRGPHRIDAWVGAAHAALPSARSLDGTRHRAGLIEHDVDVGRDRFPRELLAHAPLLVRARLTGGAPGRRTTAVVRAAAAGAACAGAEEAARGAASKRTAAVRVVIAATHRQLERTCQRHQCTTRSFHDLPRFRRKLCPRIKVYPSFHAASANAEWRLLPKGCSTESRIFLVVTVGMRRPSNEVEDGRAPFSKERPRCAALIGSSFMREHSESISEPMAQLARHRVRARWERRPHQERFGA